MSTGYKATLKVSFDELKLNIPIKYERITSKAIRDSIKVVTRADDGESIVKKFRYIDLGNPLLDKTQEIEDKVKRTKVLLGEENNKIYLPDQVKDFQLVEGKKGVEEIEVSAPTETTKDFEVSDTRPLEAWDTYLPESEYEVFGDDQNSLKQLADHLVKNELCLVFDYQRANTHKPMKAIIKPVFEPNGFILVMRLTMTKYSFKHLLDLVPSMKTKVNNRVKVALTI